MRLAGFLAHVDAVAGPLMAAAGGRIAVELAFGLPKTVSRADGGRDLDNYLYPVARRVGPQRVAALFGRKIHGLSSLAVGPAEPEETAAFPQFSARMTPGDGWQESDGLQRREITDFPALEVAGCRWRRI